MRASLGDELKCDFKKSKTSKLFLCYPSICIQLENTSRRDRCSGSSVHRLVICLSTPSPLVLQYIMMKVLRMVLVILSFSPFRCSRLKEDSTIPLLSFLISLSRPCSPQGPCSHAQIKSLQTVFNLLRPKVRQLRNPNADGKTSAQVEKKTRIVDRLVRKGHFLD